MALSVEEQASIRRAIEEYRVDAPFGRLVLLGHVTTENVDETMAMLPASVRDDFIEWIQGLVNFDGIPVGWQKPLSEDVRTMWIQWLTRIGKVG